MTRAALKSCQRFCSFLRTGRPPAGTSASLCRSARSQYSCGAPVPDYPYSLVSRELRAIIRGLLTKAAGSVELFFDHCLFTMLQELDKTPGEGQGWAALPWLGTCSHLPVSR